MNRVSSIFGAIAVIAIAVVFVVSFQPGRGQNQVEAGPQCAAEVLGECVRGTHFWASFRLIMPRGASDQFVKQVHLKESTMDGLIERELLTNDAKRLGIGVTEDDVSRELVNGRVHVSLPVARMRNMAANLGLTADGVREVPFTDKKTNAFSPEVYRRNVNEITRLSETDFREHQHQELVAMRMRDLIRSRVRISESEAKDRYLHHRTTETVKYVLLQKKWVRDHLLDRSDKAVEAWAEKNKEEVDKLFDSRKAQFAGECRIARNIFLKLDPMSKTPDEDKQKAREKLEETKKKIEGGTAFADLARQLTEDNTNDQGGDLGCVLKGQKPKPLEDALFSMKEGDVSGVIETQIGFHLVELVKIAKGEDALKIGRTATAKEAYDGYESERIAVEGAKEILAAAKGGKSLEDALKDWLAAHPPLKTAGDKPAKDSKEPKEKGGTGHEGGGDPAPPTGPEKGAKGDAPAKDGKPKDAKEKDAKAPEGAPKDKASDDKKDAGKDADKKDGDKDPADKDDADENEDESGAPKVQVSASFTISGDPFDGAAPDVNLSQIAFAMQKPGDVPNDVIPLDRGDGYGVMQLKERTEPNEDAWKEAKPFEIWSMRAFKQEDALAAYVKRLRNAAQAEIKPNDSFTADPADKKKNPDDKKSADKPDEGPKEPPPPQPE